MTPAEFLSQPADGPVYTVLGSSDLYERTDGAAFDKAAFHQDPSGHRSRFLAYARRAHIYMACHFWDPRGPKILSAEDLRDTERAIEVVADETKKRFRADPRNQGRFIQGGIWDWSRHPNYFGEITLWTGIALIAFPELSGWGYVTLVSPFFVYLLLTRVSGIPILEARSGEKWGHEPEFQAYRARTPVLFPRPPRRG